jgi:hypothetical protein
MGSLDVVKAVGWTILFWNKALPSMAEIAKIRNMLSHNTDIPFKATNLTKSHCGTSSRRRVNSVRG